MANFSVLNHSLESIFHKVIATTNVFHIYQDTKETSSLFSFNSNFLTIIFT